MGRRGNPVLDALQSFNLTYGLARKVKDSMDDSTADEIAGSKLEEVDAPPSSEPAASSAPAQTDTGGTTTPAPGSAEPAALAPKKSWAIGTGDQRKVWDTKPSDDDVRQWRYDTISSQAGSRRADDWMERTMARDKRQRDTEIDKFKLDEVRQLRADSDQLRTVNDAAMGGELGRKISAAGGVDQYIAGEEQASGVPMAPADKEKARSTYGLMQSPVTQYNLNMRRAAIVGATNPKQANEFIKDAKTALGGPLLSAVLAKDPKATKELYNVFQNGHTVDTLDFNGGNVSGVDVNGRPYTIAEKDLQRMIASQIDPMAAMKAIDSAEKSEAIIAQKNEQLQQMHYRQYGGGGNGGGGGGSGGKNKAPEVPEVGGSVPIDEFNKVISLYANGKDDGQAPSFAASVSGTRKGTFAPDEALGLANQITDYAKKNGVNMSQTEAIQRSAKVLATRSAKAALEREISAAKTDDEKKPLLKELSQLPSEEYRFNGDSIVHVLQSNGINASSDVLRTINPGANFDLTQDKALSDAIASRFEKDPQWAGYAKAIGGDGLLTGDAKQDAQLAAERHQQYADEQVRSAMIDAEEKGLSPEKREMVGAMVRQKLDTLGRYYAAYLPVQAKQYAAANDTVSSGYYRGKGAASGVPVGNYVPYNPGEFSGRRDDPNDPYRMAARARGGLVR